MKISDFIKKLEQYKDERGDLEMLFSVRDYFSTGGFDAEHFIGENDDFWQGVSSNGKQARFHISLKSRQFPGEPVKHAKVTFRK